MPGRVAAGVRLHRPFERRQVVVAEHAGGRRAAGARFTHPGFYQAHQFFLDGQDVAACGLAGLRLRRGFAKTRLAVQPRGGKLHQASAKSLLHVSVN